MSFAVLADDAVSGWSPGLDRALVQARARAQHYGEALILSTERGGHVLTVAHIERRGPCQLLLRFPLRLVGPAEAAPTDRAVEPEGWTRANTYQIDLFEEMPCPICR